MRSGTDVEKLESTLRSVVTGAGTSLVLGLLALLGVVGLFRILDDSSIIPHRPLSKPAAYGVLGGTFALILFYLAMGFRAFKHRTQWAYRVSWLLIALPILGLMLLNPFTSCALEAIQR